MKPCKAWALRTGLLFILVIFGAPLLLADNCSSYSDCYGNLGAAAAATAAAGALAGAAGASPKKKKNPCTPIRQHLETLELRLQDLLFEKQVYEEGAQSAISALYDQLNQIDQQLNALSVKIDKENQTLVIFQGYLEDAQDEAINAGEGETSPEDVAREGGKVLINLATWKSEIARTEQQIADDQAKAQALNTQEEQINQQIDTLQKALSDKLQDFGSQEAELRQLIDQTKHKLAKCEAARRT
jgi:chromosome segregation ATPase